MTTFAATDREVDVLNALMAQNDALASRIQEAEDADDLLRTNLAVSFVADLWTALGYGYKLIELRKRVSKRASDLAEQEETYIAGCRKNDKTLPSARGNLSRLNEFINPSF